MRLDGRIEDFDLLEVVQAAMRRDAPSELLIADENDEEGLLRLEGGFIVAARWRHFLGEEAIFGVLSQRRGLFSLASVDSTPVEGSTVLWSWPQLIQEAFRRAAKTGLDEGPPLAQEDLGSLEGDLDLLIHNLEADVARLSDDSGDPVALLEWQCEMLNTAVSLVPEQAKRLELRLEDVLPRHGWKGSDASFVHLDGALIQSRLVQEVYVAAAFDPQSRSLEARDSSRMLCESLDDILERLGRLVSNADGYRQKRERAAKVIGDLSDLIRSTTF